MTRRVLTACLATTLCLMGCSREPLTTDPDQLAVTLADQKLAGIGRFVFQPPAGQPEIPVYYSVPSRRVRSAQVVIVMTGVDRNAGEYLDAWKAIATNLHLIVIVPQFSSEDYPEWAYNLGGVVDADGAEQPEARWTYRIIDALFATIQKRTGTTDDAYALFGHSAGGQFVARMVEFYPQGRFQVAIAANPGWYTMPSDGTDFPYGLSGISLDESDLRAGFARRFVLLVGADDIDSHDPNLRHDEGSDAQGENRLARALSFYGQARSTAAAHDDPFAWRLTTVPGVGHQQSRMALAARRFLR